MSDRVYPGVEPVSIHIQHSGDPCDPEGVEGQVSKHCWHDPQPRGREPWHADPMAQPHGLDGKFQPFMEYRGNKDSYSHLRLHHRTLYYSNCVYVDCDVDIRDGITRQEGLNSYTFGDGDVIYLNGCCGQKYVVVFVTIERRDDKCWKKVYLLRDAFNPCAAYKDLPKTLYATACGTSVPMSKSGSYWTGSIDCGCDVFLLRMGCNVGTVFGGGPEDMPLGLEYFVTPPGQWQPAAWPLGAIDSCDPILADHFVIQSLNCGAIPVVISE